MKLNKVLFAVVLFVVSGLTYSQTKWELVFHSTYIPTLEKEMGEMIDAGYDPVGIEFVRDGVKKGVLTMYEKTDDPDFQGMKIIEVFDVETLRETLTEEAKNGYLPMDLTWLEKSIIVLFAKYDNASITEWGLDVAEATYDDIGKSLEKYASSSRQWIPVGITGLTSLKKYVLMYLKVPDVELTDYNVYTYDGLENFQAGIDQLYAEGWTICGFSIYGNEWDVVVVK